MLKIVKQKQKWEQKTITSFTFFQEDFTLMIDKCLLAVLCWMGCL